MINKKLAKILIEESLSTGADFAEIYYEETENNSVNYDHGKLENVSTSLSCGVGIRLLKDTHSVYGYTNELTKNNLLKVVRKLVGAFNDKQITHCKDFVLKKIKKINKNKGTYFKTNIDEKIKMLKTASDAIISYSNKISRARCLFIGDRKSIVIYNSNGLFIKTKNEHTRLALIAFSNDGDKHDQNFSFYGTTGNFSYFNKIDLIKEGKKTAEEAIAKLYAIECPSGKMPVIIGNGFGGVLFHEACGHSLEACSTSKNLSVFSNRIGEQIASPIVNAYDDGTIKNAWGTNNVDDEGKETERVCLIKNGILQNYLIDNFYGRRLNSDGHGCCRRESYIYEPTTRMSNTFIANGTSKVKDIFKNTKLGLFAKKLGGGSVSPITGEFEFSCTEAYIVRDGKICEQVKGATLIGTGEEVLKNIDMIADDLQLDTGYCGASSGSVPVATGQPTIRVKSILVGGNGGELK